MNLHKHKSSPPKLGQWLIKSFCSYDFQSTALWDLEELFEMNLEEKGLRRARIIYLLEAIRIVAHLFFKGQSQYSINNIAMFKHNIIITLRNFKRFKSTFFINLTGLASAQFQPSTIASNHEWPDDAIPELADVTSFEGESTTTCARGNKGKQQNHLQNQQLPHP